MKILVINCGSSSIKYKLYEMDDQSVLAAGGIEKIGLEGSFLKTKINGETKIINHECPTHTEGIKLMFDTLLNAEYGAIKSLDEISAAGHRIVAGGRFTQSQVVTDAMLEEWKQYMDLAPLHSPAHLKGYQAVKNMLPNLPQVFVFDTAFHQTMPEKCYMYAVPYKYYENNNIRRWGAHGTSHRFVSARVAEFLGQNVEDLKIITCHIGNGASITAVKDGKCFETSMGLTPLEGMMMGTRSGDIDASAVLAIMKAEGYDADRMSDLLNKESGVLGISGVSSDMREVKDAAEVLEADKKEVRALFKELQAEYEQEGRGIRIREADDAFGFVTLAENDMFLKKLCTPVRVRRLSQAALEVLAIIAYRQPVTRSEIDSIRGIKSERVIDGLIDKDLIEVAGRSEGVGRPLIYATTKEFLKKFGFASLKDLPEVPEYEEMRREREEEGFGQLAIDFEDKE
jgi:acetate kinase